MLEYTYVGNISLYLDLNLCILKDLPQEKKGRDEGRSKVIITYILKSPHVKPKSIK